jgi:hypothetical protein
VIVAALSLAASLMALVVGLIGGVLYDLVAPGVHRRRSAEMAAKAGAVWAGHATISAKRTDRHPAVVRSMRDVGPYIGDVFRSYVPSVSGTLFLSPALVYWSPRVHFGSGAAYGWSIERSSIQDVTLRRAHPFAINLRRVILHTTDGDIDLMMTDGRTFAEALTGQPP